MKPLLDRLQAALDYRFQNTTLLEQALTHRSHGADNGERLEFLGDGLLNFLIGDALYRSRPDGEEGELTRLRAHLVCEASLAKVAARLDLGELLRMGPGELKSGGFRRESIRADAFEALIGALYLDGGFEAAATAVRRLFADELAQLPQGEAPKDAKTRLQEWLQGRSRPLPEYRLLNAVGPSHRQVFTVACILNDANEQAQAEGNSRKLAEQKAAEQMIFNLEKTHA